tara:strand:- start:117 stop:245 length:129 start_codon:yes stop_codon:yes gene_type:complete
VPRDFCADVVSDDGCADGTDIGADGRPYTRYQRNVRPDKLAH